MGTAETDGRGGYNKRSRWDGYDIRSDRKFCRACAVWFGALRAALYLVEGDGRGGYNKRGDRQ